MRCTVNWLQCAVLYSLQLTSTGLSSPPGPCLCGRGCNFTNARDASKHLINVIFNKPGRLSSSWKSSPAACGAVNGNRDVFLRFASDLNPNCIHTGFSETPYHHWVEYDLLADYTVDRVILVKRTGAGQWVDNFRMKALDITLNGEICFSYPGYSKPVSFLRDSVHNLNCKKPVTGRHFRIARRNEYITTLVSYYPVTICEITIWVCEPGYYGKPSVRCKKCPSQTQCRSDLCNNYYGCDHAVLMNLAAKRPATQSSVLEGGPNNAVDTNTIDVRSHECTSTDPAQDGTRNRWWRVDLGSLARIHYVKITNRQDCCGDQLNNVMVVVSENEMDLSRRIPSEYVCQHYIGQIATGATKIINCSSVLTGRYVAVIATSPHVLHFCEVMTIGYFLRGMDMSKNWFSVPEIPAGGSCNIQNSFTYCALGSTCTENQCRITLGNKCKDAGTNYCVPGLNCAYGKCSLKLYAFCKTNQDKCQSDMMCDRMSGYMCKINVGHKCKGNVNCVSGTFCDGLKRCRLPVESSCHVGHDMCQYGAMCDSASGNRCKLTLGQSCTVPSFCKSGTICDVVKICKKPVGHSCTSWSECIAGASCTNSKCFCNGTSDSACDPQEGRAGGPCSAERQTICTEHSTCISGICTCDENYGVYTFNYTCRLSVAGAPCQHLYECNTGLTCIEGICRAAAGHKCNRTTDCTNGSVCDSAGICKITVGQNCSQFPDLCETSAVCGNGICKLQLEQDCDWNNDQCIEDAVCSTTGSTSQTTCKLKPGLSCTGQKSTLCASMTVCEASSVCKLKAGESCAEPFHNHCQSGTICSNQTCRFPVGADCKSDEDCEPGTVCDAFLSQCRLQVKARCAAPSLKDMCTAGASCNDQGVCVCAGSGTSRPVQNKCEPADRKVSGLCVTADLARACDDQNAICLLDGKTNTTKCTCQSGFEVETTSYTCSIGVGKSCVNTTTSCGSGTTCFSGFCYLKVGQNCIGDNARWCKHGSVCENDVCKANLHGYCSGSDKNNCKSGTVCDNLSQCKFPVNSTCSTGVLCVAGATCVRQTCQCFDLIAKPNGLICEAVLGSVTAKCKSSACNDPNAICSAQGICRCQDGYTVQPSNLSCKKAVNSPCSAAKSDCTIGTICDETTNTCRLQLGQHCGHGNEEFCTPDAVCDIDQRCKLNFGGNCKDNEMHCKSGFFCDFEGLCKFGTFKTCSNDSQCAVGALCMNSTCRCSETQAMPDGAICVPRSGFVGGYCDDITPCNGNAICLDDICICAGSRRNGNEFHCFLPSKGAPESEVGGYLWIILMVIAALVLISAIAFLAVRQKHKKEEMKNFREELHFRMANTKQLALDMETNSSSPPRKKKKKKKRLPKGEEAPAKDNKTSAGGNKATAVGDNAKVPETDTGTENDMDVSPFSDDEHEETVARRARRLQRPDSKMGLVELLKPF